MQAWFQNLSRREQLIVSLGGLFLIIMGFYYAIWSPLSNAATDAATNYQQQVELLDYLNQSVPRLLAHRGSTQPQPSNEPLLTQLENSINNTKLTTYLSNIQQQGDSINLRFDSVPFDSFITWLQTFSQGNKISIDSLTVDKLSTPGLVKLTMVVK